MNRLIDQLREATQAFADFNPRPALIGGLALSAHGVVRATSDLDFLIASEHADKVQVKLLSLGYECRFRSADAANYVRENQGLDVLYASRPISRDLLGSAQTRNTPFGSVPVVSAEGLIGFKIQAWVNNPQRAYDIEDIRSLLRENLSALNLDQIRNYFRLFDHEAMLDELLESLGR